MLKHPLRWSANSVVRMDQQSQYRRNVLVTLRNGLHLVPCSRIAEYVRDYDGDVVIRNEEVAADAKSVFDLITLRAECGTQLVLEATGAAAQSIVDGLAGLFESNFAIPQK